MKTDEQIQAKIQKALHFQPALNPSQIGVTVTDGIVTLSGIVDSFAKKIEAENVCKSIAGVKAIVLNVEIHFSDSLEVSDFQIAEAVLMALKSNSYIPYPKVRVRVGEHILRLDGELEFNYQREAVINAVKNIKGIKEIVNHIKIKSESVDAIEKQHIIDALQDNWAIDNRGIDVTIDESTVILTGSVSSFFQKEEATRIAFNAKGVNQVENKLFIDFDYSFCD